MHWLRQQQLAAVTGQALNADGSVPAGITNEALALAVQQLTTLLAQKLNRTGDALTGVLTGMASTDPTAFVTYAQLLAGGKFGVRMAKDVGNSFVNLGEPVTDPLNLGRMAYPLFTVQFPTVAGTLPVFSMGYNSPNYNNVYSSLSISLPSALPAIGGVELLTVPLTRTSIIPTAGAGTQLKFKVTTGTWTGILIYAFV